jgi:hypothetical protein
MTKEPSDRTLREENAIGMMACSQATDIYAIFVEMFGFPPGDETLRQLPIESTRSMPRKVSITPCGGQGDDADELDVIVEYVNDVIAIFWRG